ncbi:hypothetical protein NB063_15390 [Rhodopirellula sp. ICT_H3.1]|uniref:Transmembrane protein n=2 Tax=Aporhodopirellula aestuarii TaxID=2950107 RepID=A0ABT0U505_9BACT|nr:hypothetical protein [Aporhodopirellula aestuarii]MCM2371988.1 hypothetical protein [Aporhodopirellula aestuarii]
MSHSIWDWWFGDGQTQHSTTNYWRVRRIERMLHRANGSAARRRLGVFLAALGVTCVGGIASTVAAELGTGNTSLDWGASTTFAMIIADEESDEKSPVVEKNDAANAAEGLQEDELRRKRLRDLLGEDDDPTSRGDEINNDAPVMDRGRDQPMLPSELDEDGDFAKPFIEERLPEIDGGRFVLPPIRAVSIDQAPIGNGRLPDGLVAGKDLQLVPLPEDGYSRLALTGGGAWPQLIRPWAAPNTFSHPLYFEDRMLERHGHERWGCFQPLASGARFFTTFPMLPYLATVQEPCDIVYSKGYYRAGSPVPKFYQRPPLEARAVVVESAVVSGTFIALP